MRAVAQADWVIDVGPGAGNASGRIVVVGTTKQITENQDSRTAPYVVNELVRRENKC